MQSLNIDRTKIELYVEDALILSMKRLARAHHRLGTKDGFHLRNFRRHRHYSSSLTITYSEYVTMLCQMDFNPLKLQPPSMNYKAPYFGSFHQHEFDGPSYSKKGHLHYSYEKCDSNHRGAYFLRDNLDSFPKFN